MKSIFDMLKIAAVEDDLILTSSMRRFSVWKTEGADCYFRTLDMSRAYSFFMREAKEGTTAECFRVSLSHDAAVDCRCEAESELMIRQRLNFIREKGIKKSLCFFTVSDDSPKSGLPEKSVDIEYHKAVAECFGTNVERFGTVEIMEILYGMISFDGAMQISPDMSVREKLVQKQCQADPEFFKIGDSFCKVLSLKFLPRETVPFMVSYLSDYFLADHIFAVSFTILPQSGEMLSLEAKERFYRASAGRGAAHNAEETDELMELLASSKHKIVFMSAKIILWEKDLLRLEKNCADIVSLMKNGGFFFEEETWGHDIEFFRSLPSQMSCSERQLRVLSPNFADMLPAAKHGHGDCDSLYPLFLRNRFGEIYGFDAGSQKRNNRNGSLYGCSGSGKSVTVNALIAHTFFPNIKADKEHPGKIFIVDFAGAENSSYLKMAELFGGTFIPIDPHGKIVINPFPERSEVFSDGKWDASWLNFINIVMDLVLEIREKNMNADLFRNIVSKAVRNMYLAKEHPVLGDLVDFIEDSDDTKAGVIKKLLLGFLDDPVSKMINGKSSADPGKQPFVIYDLQGISGLNEKLRELLTFIVIQEAKKSAFEITNSFIIFDEAAQLIKDPRMADLIEELFATARKYNTGVWTVTQNFISFKDSSLSSKIKLNTTTTIFLSHADDEEAKRAVSEDFGFTPQEKEAFGSLRTVKGEYALALFRTQKSGITESEVVRVELSPFDYLIATSDKGDNRLLKALAEKTGISLVDACAEAALLASEKGIFAVEAVKELLKRGRI